MSPTACSTGGSRTAADALAGVGTGLVLHATAHGFMTPTWVRDVTPFTVGETLDVPGRPRAIGTPGHTEGHVSFLLEDRGVVVTGDAIASLDAATAITQTGRVYEQKRR